MHRRRVLLGTVGIGVTALAGCLTGKSPFTLEVVHTDFGKGPDGNLQVRVTVSNVGNDPQQGVLYVRSTLNGDSNVRVRKLSLDAHATRDVTITYDVKYDDVSDYSPKATVEPVQDTTG